MFLGVPNKCFKTKLFQAQTHGDDDVSFRIGKRRAHTNPLVGLIDQDSLLSEAEEGIAYGPSACAEAFGKLLFSNGLFEIKFSGQQILPQSFTNAFSVIMFDTILHKLPSCRTRCQRSMRIVNNLIRMALGFSIGERKAMIYLFVSDVEFGRFVLRHDKSTDDFVFLNVPYFPNVSGESIDFSMVLIP